MGQPRSSWTRRGFGGAARQLPGAGDPRNFGGCRAGAWRVCDRITPAIADRSGPCRARRLAGRAGSRHRHPLPNMQDYKAGPTEPARAVCQVPEDKMTENQRGCLVLPHTTLGGVRGGSNAARRQVIQIPGGFARTRRKRLIPPGFPDDLMCPGFPGDGLLDPGRPTGRIWQARSSYSIRVSLPPGMSDSRAGFTKTGPGVPVPPPGRSVTGWPKASGERGPQPWRGAA